MKKIFYPILMAAAMLTACNEKVDTADSGFGAFSLSVDAPLDHYVTKADAPDKNDFKVEITGPKNLSYDRYGDMPQVIQDLPSGTYTVTVSSGDSEPVAFEQPVYGGSATFEVKTGGVATAKVVASIRNVMVTIVPTAEFLSELTTYEIHVYSEELGKLVWSSSSAVEGAALVTTDINTAGHFAVPSDRLLQIAVKGYREVSNEEATWTGTISGVAAKDHYAINVDANTTGSLGGLVIELDGGLNLKPTPVTIPGFEEVGVDGPDNGDMGDDSGDDDTGSDESAITLEWPGNESFGVMEIDGNQSVELTVKAPAGIKDFKCTLVSDTPEFTSLVSNMTSDPFAEGERESVVLDFINDQVTVTAMAEDPISLPTGDQLKDETEVLFPLTTLVGWIPSMGGAGPDTNHTFTLTVVDNDGNTKSWELTFHVPEA